MELQKLRYGENAFHFEVIEDAQVGDSHIPSLVLQTLVENSVVHAVNLDRLVRFPVYITSEVYERRKISLSVRLRYGQRIFAGDYGGN